MATLTATTIKPGTTPLLTVIVDGQAIQDATIYVTIDMGDRSLVKSNWNNCPDVTAEAIYDDDEAQVGTEISVQFSQDETLFLRPGNASIEVGWVFEDGTADKSNIGRLRIPKTLYKGVMIYG